LIDLRSERHRAGAGPQVDARVEVKGRRDRRDFSSQKTELAVTAAAITDGAYTLFVADSATPDTTWAAYQELKSLEDGATRRDVRHPGQS